jgi:hypothetical protein
MTKASLLAIPTPTDYEPAYCIVCTGLSSYSTEWIPYSPLSYAATSMADSGLVNASREVHSELLFFQVRVRQGLTKRKAETASPQGKLLAPWGDKPNSIYTLLDFYVPLHLYPFVARLNSIMPGSSPYPNTVKQAYTTSSESPNLKSPSTKSVLFW